MKLRVDGELVDCEAYSLSYGNDLLDGVILDLPDHYIYLSDHVEEARDMMAQLPDDIQHFDLNGYDVDWEQVPHCYVLQSVGRMIVRSAEEACSEAAE